VWSITPSPNKVPVNGQNSLVAVSCVSASSCKAVGYYDNLNGVGQYSLVESWNGISWSITPSPNSASIDELEAVSCVSPTFCVAVGETLGGPVQTLIERWNGTAWSITPSPNEGGPAGNSDDYLFGVSCVSASSCKAVGSYFDYYTNADGTLVESWNGSTWSITRSPNTSHGDVLQAVSCVSASSCKAAGRYRNGTADRTLIESWNGTSWSITPSPNGGTGNSDLYGVSCVSASSCKAVGGAQLTSTSFGRTLIESWNGTAWSVVPSPNQGTSSNNSLSGVSCVSASFCTAVGNSPVGTLIESWNGTSWSITPSPNPATPYASLSGVSCVAPSFCEAAGTYFSGLHSTRSLVESRR
jgi:hypothetical protein